MHSGAKLTRPTLEVCLCLALTCLAPRPIDPNGLAPVALSPASKSHLRPAFTITLTTLSILVVHILDATNI